VIRLGPAQPAFTILLVCTGNICRSALGERLGRAYLAELLGENAAAIQLASAGTRAVVDSGMHPDSALVLKGFGADAGDFRARQFVEGMAAEADLILTMTRGHRRDVLQASPRALARTFTLREAADLIELLGESVDPSGPTLAERGRRLVQAMATTRSRRHGGEDDDVRDPIQQPIEVHQQVGEAIVGALLPVLRRLASLDTAGTDDAPAPDSSGAPPPPVTLGDPA
jgi:protein-tyrosine-phosphatase